MNDDEEAAVEEMLVDLDVLTALHGAQDRAWLALASEDTDDRQAHALAAFAHFEEAARLLYRGAAAD